jgi:hypothetical protein
LAGSSSDKNIDICIFASLDCGEIAVKRNARVMVSKNSPRERINLGEERRLPAEWMPRGSSGFNA